MLHPQGHSNHNVSRPRSLELPHFVPLVHKSRYRNQLVRVFGLYHEGLPISNCVFQRTLPFIVFKNGFCSHHTMLAVDYVKFSFLEGWPILLCNFHHRVLRCHTNRLSVKFGIVHDVVHLPSHLTFFFRPCIHTLGPFVALVNVYVKRKIPTKWPTIFCLLIELLEYLLWTVRHRDIVLS